ncbi:hypothetical protein D3P07_01285 [Paenibacillus sp. 1011MAR3C5]|uniref:nucleotidyltransferase domain-containing protein n=1 Tax=Paenibacillus sp. 1011MAR3C5 TaxID=1675787 RepID=UPI000E6BDC9E|nr:nucleotidyltransferase domain-containing protein [Paenibacillus sp. 1011MAR3C5]RJE90763.1 hypothetical protein D3P07_01285 [Paenibacillus sp. 1011MAR3C5]
MFNENSPLKKSTAKGTENHNSDIDIGIYYDSDKGLDITPLRQVAAEIDDGHRENLITEISDWGPWINGGGWMKVNHRMSFQGSILLESGFVCKERNLFDE